MPPPLIQIVRHCLEKDPTQRFQSGARHCLWPRGVVRRFARRAGLQPFSHRTGVASSCLAWRLSWLSPSAWDSGACGLGLAAEPTNEGIPALAALPLTNLSGNPEDEYFTDGMTDSLITDLARTERLAVIARAAVFRFKDQAIDPQKAGQTLGARYVLHGSVQRSGDSVRVNVRLVDVATGYNVWAEAFDESTERRVRAPEQDFRSNRRGARVEAVARRRPAAHRTPHHQRAGVRRLPAGTVLFAQARRGLPRARGDILRAGRTRQTRSSRWPHAALGSAYTQHFFYKDPDRRWEQKAFLAIEKALALDAGLAEGYLARAQLAWSLPNGFPHERAVRDLQRAIAIKPSLADAHIELGKIYVHIGLLDKAIAENTQALRLDPGSLAARGRLALSHSLPA